MVLTNNDKLYINNLLSSKLDEIEQKFENKLTEFRDDFYTKIDPILKEVTASREERTLLSAYSKNHTDRIEKLEKIHPQGKHSAAIA